MCGDVQRLKIYDHIFCGRSFVKVQMRLALLHTPQVAELYRWLAVAPGAMAASLACCSINSPHASPALTQADSVVYFRHF